MYCTRCGAEFGPKEQTCLNCGELRPGRERKCEKSNFMNWNGLKDSYIPVMWELLVLIGLGKLIPVMMISHGDIQSLMGSYLNVISGSLSAASTAEFSQVLSSLASSIKTLWMEISPIEQLSTAIDLTADLAFGMLFLLAFWRIFKKAGCSGWKVLIPFYNIYCLIRIVMGSGGYVLFLLLVVVLLALAQTNLMSLGASGLQFMLICIAGFGIVAGFVFARKFSARFSHGWGYTFGLLFMTPLFILLLGWGKNIAVVSYATERETERKTEKVETEWIRSGTYDRATSDVDSVFHDEEMRRRRRRRRRRQQQMQQMMMMQQQQQQMMIQQQINDQQQVVQQQLEQQRIFDQQTLLNQQLMNQMNHFPPM